MHPSAPLMSSTHSRPPADLDALLDLASCPADRLWRYPLCRVMVRPVMRLPVTANHITLFHTMLAVMAGAIVSAGTPRAFVAAGVLFEMRAILDCFDGVVARAKGTSSPVGRALDQLGDSIGFASLMLGGLVCLARLHGWATAAAMVVVASLVAASGTAAWDFFRRRIASLLRDGHDATEEEYVSLCRASSERGGAVLWVSRVVQGFQWYSLSPQSLPRMRERVARGDDPAATDAPSPLGRALRAAAARHDPELRATLLRVGFVGGDNVIFLFTASLLLGRFVHAFPFVTLWGAAVWGYTVVTVNRYLHDLSRAPSSATRSTV